LKSYLSEPPYATILSRKWAFIRKANSHIFFLFFQAGCLHWATRITLEPEAASIYCQNQPNVNFKELLKNKNTKYLVVDIGGT